MAGFRGERGAYGDPRSGDADARNRHGSGRFGPGDARHVYGEDAAARSTRRAQLAASFSGEWVAVSRDWSRLYAHGASYLAVCAGAAAQGARDPLIARL